METISLLYKYTENQLSVLEANKQNRAFICVIEMQYNENGIFI